MKYLRTYEKMNEPEIGDYVICEEDESVTNDIVSRFINNNIGKILFLNKKWNINGAFYPYIVRYFNIPPELIEDNFDINNCRGIGSMELKHWSKNKEELEIILTQIKYNL